jgi:sulfatase modifying factor 1
MAWKPWILSFLVIASGTVSTQAQVPDPGLSWRHVGAAGNQPFVGNTPLSGRGAVAHEFSITDTEITNTQWAEFCNAYAPFYQGDPYSPYLTGQGVFLDNSVTPAVYRPFETLEQAPAGVTWRIAAHFANWMHNDCAISAQAFVNGAYDTSTFGGTFGAWTDQRNHNPGARFWLPTVDEWMKAAYYDPHRFGTGQGGWWEYPDSSDTPLVPGPPGQGETNAGYMQWGFPNGSVAVGQYPQTRSPWGLMDLSGGLREMTEGPEWRVMGSDIDTFTGVLFIEDRIGESLAFGPTTFMAGFRLVSAIPAPGSVGLLFIAALWRRNRRCGA